NLGLRSSALVGRIAHRIQQTLCAPRVSCSAERPAMHDYLMREQNPFLLRNDLDEVLFDLHWIGIFGQIEPARDALHVRVYHDSGCDSVRRPQPHIGSLSRRTRYREQFFDGSRHLPAEIAEDLPCGPHDRLRFVVEETSATNILSQYFWTHRCEV